MSCPEPHLMKAPSLALHHACENQNPHSVETLVALGCSVNHRCEWHYGTHALPLHISCAKDDARNVRILLAAKADVLLRTESGGTVMELIRRTGGSPHLGHLVQEALGPWAVAKHGVFPKAFKRGIRTILMALKRLGGASQNTASPAALVPMEIWFAICATLPFRWQGRPPRYGRAPP